MGLDVEKDARLIPNTDFAIYGYRFARWMRPRWLWGLYYRLTAR